MAQSKLKIEARRNYKYTPLLNWILGIETGLLIAAILALDLLVPFLSALTFPLIVLPIIFSAILQHISLKAVPRLTVKGTVKGFGLYYRRDFFGSFSVIPNLLKSALLFFFLQTVISLLASTFFTVFSSSFNESVQILYQTIMDDSTSMADLENVLTLNGGILLNYLIICFFPAYIVATLFFLYLLSRNTLTIYYKTHFRFFQYRFSGFIYRMVLGGRRFKLLFTHLSLNWPLYLLILTGMVGGAFIGYYWQHDLLIMLALSNVGGALLMTFFLPFFFSNQEAYYDMFIPEFTAASNKFAESILKSGAADSILSQEEKEKIQRIIDETSKEEEKDKTNNK